MSYPFYIDGLAEGVRSYRHRAGPLRVGAPAPPDSDDIRAHMRSGSHLDEFAARVDLSLAIGGIQNVIQAVSLNPYFHEDLACAATHSFDVARASELRCSKIALLGLPEGIGAERNEKQ